MKTFRFRIALIFALAAMALLALLFAVGYRLLESRLVAGLDLMIASHTDQIVAKLAFDIDPIDQNELKRRIREANEHFPEQVYITVTPRRSDVSVSYRSTKLSGRSIPVVDEWNAFTVAVPGIGLIRAQATRLGPFEIVLGTPLAPVTRSMASYVWVGAGLLAATIVLGGAVGFVLSHLVLAPIRTISATAAKIDSHNLAARIPVGKADDELNALARLLNRMFDRLELAFDQISRFSCEASHELKTPLTLMRLHAERMLRDPGLPPEHTEAVVVQIEEIARLDRIIDELLFLSRAEAGAVVLRPSPQDPELLLIAFHRDASVLSEPRGCRYRFRHEGCGRAIIEETWMRQVMFNLLANALDVSPPASTINVLSEIKDGTWRVAVEDEGPGLAPALRARMFDRFARFNIAKDVDRGSGLGLAICRKLVELHGGRIYASDKREGSGLRVVFELPALPA